MGAFISRGSALTCAFIVSACLCAASGCVLDVDYGDSTFSCRVQPICPDGLICVEGMCVGAAGGDDGDDAELELWLDGWDRRKRIDIAAGVVSADLGEVVVPVMLSGDQDLAGAADSTGSDIVFTDADGETLLAHEIESYDPDTGALAAWVRVPSVGASGAAFYLYYSGQAAAGNAIDTWLGAGSFASVWHLGNSAAASPIASASDSVRDNDAVVAIPGMEPSSVAGIAGNAASFVAGTSGLNAGDPEDGSLDFGLDSFSFSLWANVEISLGSFDIPWHKGGSSAGNIGYDIELGTDAWNACVADTIAVHCAGFGAETDFLGGWVHLVAVVDRGASQLRVYANGSLRDAIDIAAVDSLDSPQPVSVSADGNQFNGSLDEIRIQREVLGEDRITFDHQSLSDPAAVFTLGAEEGPPEPL